MKRKMVIFDMDGVLFDTITFAMKYILDLYPSMTEEMYKELHAENYHIAIKKQEHLKKERTEEDIARAKEWYPKEKEKQLIFPGAKECLESLHKKYILTLNTSAYAKNCIPFLEKNNIKNFFDFIGTKETSESKVEKFKIIKEKYGVSNNDLVFVTDALGDIKEAREVGIFTIAVTWGVHDRNYFEREEFENLIGVVDSFEELQKLIDLKLK